MTVEQIAFVIVATFALLWASKRLDRWVFPQGVLTADEIEALVPDILELGEALSSDQISRRLHEHTGKKSASGTLSRALDRLEQRGVLASFWMAYSPSERAAGAPKGRYLYYPTRVLERLQ